MRRWTATALLLVATLCGALGAAVARADDDPWDAGSNWMFLRAGMARNAADGAGNGGAGYGIGFRHFLKPSRVSDWKVVGIKPLGMLHWTLFKQWSIGGFAEYDVLGRYGSAADIEVPAAVELSRYMMWRSAARPYVSFGVGPFYRKLYKTGSDFSRVKTSGFVAVGFDAPVTSSQILGFDVRVARVQSQNEPVNPVFGGGQFEANHWSAKLTYSIAY
jgi:hypothetical protein